MVRGGSRGEPVWLHRNDPPPRAVPQNASTSGPLQAFTGGTTRSPALRTQTPVPVWHATQSLLAEPSLARQHTPPRHPPEWHCVAAVHLTPAPLLASRTATASRRAALGPAPLHATPTAKWQWSSSSPEHRTRTRASSNNPPVSRVRVVAAASRSNASTSSCCEDCTTTVACPRQARENAAMETEQASASQPPIGMASHSPLKRRAIVGGSWTAVTVLTWDASTEARTPLRIATGSRDASSDTALTATSTTHGTGELWSQRRTRWKLSPASRGDTRPFDSRAHVVAERVQASLPTAKPRKSPAAARRCSPSDCAMSHDSSPAPPSVSVVATNRTLEHDPCGPQPSILNNRVAPISSSTLRSALAENSAAGSVQALRGPRWCEKSSLACEPVTRPGRFPLLGCSPPSTEWREPARTPAASRCPMSSAYASLHARPLGARQRAARSTVETRASTGKCPAKEWQNTLSACHGPSKSLEPPSSPPVAKTSTGSSDATAK